MEPRPAFLHPPGNNACWESESKPSGQQKKGNISPGTRTRLGEKHGIEVDIKAQKESCASRESSGQEKTLKHTTLATTATPAEALSASKIPTMHSPTTKQVNTTATNKTASKQPTKTTTHSLELSLSGQTPSTGPKPRSPNTNHEKKLQAGAKLFPKNIQKAPSTSHIMGSTDSLQKTLHKTASASQISSTDSPKSLHRTSLSHIPRAASSPKVKLSHPASVKPDKFEQNKRVASKEGLLSNSPKNKVIDASVESKPNLGAKASTGESLQGREETERETLGDERDSQVNPASERLKGPEDKTDAYVTTQERCTGKSERLREQKEREGSEIEEKQRTGERMEIKNDKMAAGKNQTLKVMKDAVTMTHEVFPLMRMKDAGLQTDLNLVYVDDEVQATVEVCSRSTEMSPVRDAQPHQPNSETDLEFKHNDINPDSNSDSDWLAAVSLSDSKPMGAKPRFLGPLPYKSPNSQKAHVCEIEIELRSQSLTSDVPQVTITDFNTGCEVSSEESCKLLKTGEKEESRAPQEIVWDEQGMTWEVYGASLDMESLGFAIQSHLQCKIREHERRIGTLRKSICLSEQSPGKRTGKRKRNVFRSLFPGSNCCSKPQHKEELAH